MIIKNYTIWITLSLAACPTILAAQNASPLNRFEADYVKGCAPLTIQITDNSGSGVSVYQYEGSGSGTTNQLSYTYSNPGQYYVVQTIQNFDPRQDSLLITVLQPDPPDFDLFTCESLGASIQITDTQYDKYEINYGDNTKVTVNSSQAVPDHFYATGGNYTISVLGQYNNAANNCGSNSKSFTTINSILPATLTLLEVQDNGDMILNYNLSQNILYDIQIAVESGTTFQKLKTISNQSSSDTISGLSATRNYCFRIVSYDPCAGNTIGSNIICSSRLTAKAADGQNELTWSTVSGEPTGFEIVRDQAGLNTPGPNATKYTDTDIECNIDYCYSLVTNFAGGGMATTADQCVTSFSTKAPAPIKNVSVSVTGTDLDIEWFPSTLISSASYILRKSTDGRTFINTDTLTTTNTTLPGENISCFKVFQMDGCGNISKSARSACRIVLSGVQIQNDFSMTWNDYEGWQSGVNNYEVNILDDQMGLLLTVDNDTSTTLLQNMDNFDSQVLNFLVKAKPVDPAISEVSSNIVTLTRDPVINIPRAFTPNQDGLNDIFQITGKFIASQSLLIFDRWGQIVYKSSDNSGGWDGKIGGKLAPAGPYAYDVEIIDSTGRNFNRKGSFVLLR